MGGCHYDEQIQGGETEEKEKQSGSCAVERSRAGEAKPVRNKLVLVACLPPGAKVTSRPGMLPRAMSGFMVLLRLGSVLLSMASVTTEGHSDAGGLVNHLSPCWYPIAMLPLEPCQSE